MADFGGIYKESQGKENQKIFQLLEHSSRRNLSLYSRQVRFLCLALDYQTNSQRQFNLLFKLCKLNYVWLDPRMSIQSAFHKVHTEIFKTFVHLFRLLLRELRLAQVFLDIGGYASELSQVLLHVLFYFLCNHVSRQASCTFLSMERSYANSK